MIFTNPLCLYLLPLAILPLLFLMQPADGFPSLAVVDADGVSQLVEWALRFAGCIALVGLILGIAGPALRERTIERIGKGAHVVLLIDRSASMNDTFAGRQPSGAEESKSGAAKRLLKDFVNRREHDQFGVAAFSTAPIHIVPITGDKGIVLGAIDAIDRPGLAFTDVGRGLGMALDMIDADKTQASHAILLVSDGGAVIARRVQEKLREDFARIPVRLYFLYLRTKGSFGMFEPPPKDVEDTPQVLPERHLNMFLQSLHIPYRAFEAESPKAVENAIAEIGKLEQTPIVYNAHIPQYDLSRWAYGAAILGLLFLVASKMFERSLSRIVGGEHGA